MGKYPIQDEVADKIVQLTRGWVKKNNIEPATLDGEFNPKGTLRHLMQTEVLYNKALEFAGLTGEETVFDAYCGTGTITLYLSQKDKKVYGVDIIDQSIINAKENANINNVDNVEFFVGKSEEIIPTLINDKINADVIVIDPPRKGCDIKRLDAIGESGARTVVYVSCDPSTLARNLKILEAKGYQTMEVQPVDMFPQTAHVECVVKLERKNS